MSLNFDDVSGFFRRVARGDIFRRQDTFADYLTKTGLYDSEQDVVANFDHLVEDVHKWLEAKGYTHAMAVMDYMLEKKQGVFRKDKKTPGALHELTQAIWFISCIEDGLPVDHPEGVLSLIFAHDLGEDYGITPEKLWQYLHNEKGFTESPEMDEFLEDFDVISKRWGKDGPLRYKNDYEYYLALQVRRNASVAKMIDRAHNIMTLIGVKENEGSEDKIRMMEYVAKTLQLQNDYVRNASQAFPSQATMYLTLSHLIEMESQVCRYYIVNTGKKITDDDDLRNAMPERGFRKLPNGFHPLIFAAERIRHTYPETHLAAREDTVSADLDHGIISGGGRANGSGDQDVAGDIPEVSK
ncbi:MAG: hypothetical protein KDI65_05630 [Alphaproteobacteria bacterium]|nr:hypothetical protein [Alphaproteobacteria bacterium]